MENYDAGPAVLLFESSGSKAGLFSVHPILQADLVFRSFEMALCVC